MYLLDKPLEMHQLFFKGFVKIIRVIKYQKCAEKTSRLAKEILTHDQI